MANKVVFAIYYLQIIFKDFDTVVIEKLINTDNSQKLVRQKLVRQKLVRQKLVRQKLVRQKLVSRKNFTQGENSRDQHWWQKK